MVALCGLKPQVVNRGLFLPCKGRAVIYSGLVDHPMGKPNSMSLHFSVPAPLVVAGNGGVWAWMKKMDGAPIIGKARMPSTYGISINVGPYACWKVNIRVVW